MKNERTIRTIGSVFRFTSMQENIPFVVTKYVNNNVGDWGALCSDETFYYMPVESLEKLIDTCNKEGKILSYEELILNSGYKRYRNKPPMELLPNEAPFSLEVFDAVRIRRMKPRTITTVVYE